MTEENETQEETPWGTEFAPNMKLYSFDASGNEIEIVEKALVISEKLSSRKFRSAYFVFVFQKFVEFYERGLLN